MLERWKDIKGYEGLYKVSDCGRIKSLKKKVGFYFRKEIILCNCKQQRGYLAVNLSKNGKAKRFLVHRLVATAFIDNPKKLKQINHIDGNKNNNSINNLEWCTASENISHAFKLGLNHQRPPINYGKLNANSKKVAQFDLNMNLLKNWDCIMDVTRELKIDNSQICKCCKGIFKSAGGYIWRYRNVDE